MFTPLANNKPNINNEVDRNSSSVNSKTNIIGGYRMDNPNTNSAFFNNCNDFTVAFQFVISDRFFNTFIRRDNNMFQISKGNSGYLQLWPCMTGENNNFLPTWCPDLFNLDGQGFVSSLENWVVGYRNANSSDAFFNPDLNNQFSPIEAGKPYTFVFSMGTQHPSGSACINGTQTSCGWQARQGQIGNITTSTDSISSLPGSQWRWSVNGYPDTGAPVSETSSNSSVAQMAFWTGSLNVEEMKVVSNQPFGEPLDVLNAQPSFHYYYEQDYKVNKRTALDGDEIANNSYNNLGSIGDQDYAQFTLADGVNFNYSATESYDREAEQYRNRI
jgi:hypothetical protein